MNGFHNKTNFVKIFTTGVCRFEKTVLMERFKDVLKSDGAPEDKIFSFNLEYPEFFSVRSGDDLADIVFSKIPKENRSYVFFDEVQRAEGWERVINSLMAGTNADIYITGSNAHPLSSELSTYLTGRYVSIDMLPLSF